MRNSPAGAGAPNGSPVPFVLALYHIQRAAWSMPLVPVSHTIGKSPPAAALVSPLASTPTVPAVGAWVTHRTLEPAPPPALLAMPICVLTVASDGPPLPGLKS